MINVLFICECNICRSPMAEYIFKYIMRDVDNITISSAGISSERIGENIYLPARECLERHGIPYENRKAVRMTLSDYFNYDYIICMDEWTRYNTCVEMIRDPNKKISRLLDYANIPVENLSKDDAMIALSIFDPYQSGDFEKAYNDIYNGCVGLREKILKSLL